MDDELSIQADAPLTTTQAIANLSSPDLGLRKYAAWWLGKFRIEDPAAIPGLIAALTDEEDRTPEGGYPLRRSAARALGKLKDWQAVTPLIECLQCSDFYVREAAAQSLETLGDPSCIPPLVEMLAVAVSDGRLLPQGEDFSQPYDSILEALGTLGATAAVPLIQPFLEHPIPRVKYASLRAMYQLTQDNVYGDRLTQALSNSDLQVRRALLSDLGAIGYLPAAIPISQAHAENSLKLIALKGILEAQITLSPFDRLSDGAVRVMQLMDELL
ncbi:HEAT repeat domain-containing protein [Chamaesiphon minutus]|uniref:HEAT repeat-containing protein n=1 Tax=Chamaesiphon minutus (strain ATCC 27169 / PCC 6605) TaxID=1173020 RepID=K9UDJ4_CHAP6|nr:HEAT repeat domain-containing protein [Chamaesiphon minutus]AFY92496.1 HEAT repeat-containing protein [Chamaesiphon minutus PCC 6605]